MIREVDFVAERGDGQVLPIEVKFRKQVREDDIQGLLHFIERYDKRLEPMRGIVVTRAFERWDTARRILFVPLHSFLLSY